MKLGNKNIYKKENKPLNKKMIINNHTNRNAL